MTQDQIIRMAREAGFIESNAHSDIIVRHSNGSWVDIAENLEHFATLVAAAEREACAKLADACDYDEGIAESIRARGNHA